MLVTLVQLLPSRLFLLLQDAIQATIAPLNPLEDDFLDAHKRGRGVCRTMVDTVQELIPKDKFRPLLTRLITDAQFLNSVG